MLLLVLGLLGALPARATRPSFTVRAYTVADGLPNRRVQALWVAPSGALWLGTASGIVRFDGTTFYRPAALAGVLTLAMTGDGEEYLWIGGYDHDGVRRFDLRTGAVRQWATDPAGGPGIDQQVCALLVSRRGEIYVGTAAGWLLRFSAADQKFRRVGQVAALVPHKSARIIKLSEDAGGNLWCSTSHAPGAYRYTPRNRSMHLYPDLPPTSGDTLARIFPAAAVATDARGIVAGSFSGLGMARYRAASDAFEPLHVPPSDGRAGYYDPVLYLDDAGRYWSGRWQGGLQCFDPATGVTLSVNQAFGTAGNGLCASSDRAGGLWLGTTEGLLHLTELPVRFAARLNAPASRPLAERPSLRGIAELADGRLLVAGYNGMYVLRGDAPAPPERLISTVGPRVATYVYAVLPDSADRGAWVATEGAGLGWLDLLTGRLHVDRAPFDDRGRPILPLCRVLLRNADGSLLLGTYEGVFRVTHPGTPAARYHRLTARAWPEVRYLNCFALTRRGDELWACARQGVYVFDAPTGRALRRLRPGQVTLPVRAMWVQPDAAATVWLGTDGGLVRLDPSARPGRQLRVYDQRAGLSNDAVAALLPDSSGGLWVSTYNGLTRFDLRTAACQRFLLPDGLSAAEFNHGSALRTRAGRLLFGSVNGLTVVAARRLPVAPRPRLLLTRLAWFDGATRREQERWLGLKPGMDLTLDPDDEGFTLYYTLNDLADPARHRFRYRLRGLETAWTAAGAAHSLHYSRLPPGQYTLEMHAAGADGRWLAAPNLLRVRVIAPFYARWWFVLLGGLLAASLVVAAWRYRLRRLRELAAVRVRLAADLHDEVGAWLTRVSLHAELARVASPTPAQQQQQLEKLTVASQQAIATMSDVVWAVDARNDTLGDLIDRLREHANQLLEPRGITFDFTAERLDRGRALPPELRQHLFLIGKEAIHNVARHSATARAWVFLGNRDGAFELEVGDDGPARATPTSGSRQGLRNMHLRAGHLPGASLTIDRTAGFRVRLRLAQTL